MSRPENLDNGCLRVFHAALPRWSEESDFRVHCPMCDGLLLVTRDQRTLRVSRRDRCIRCGQAVWYLDDQIGGEPFDSSMRVLEHYSIKGRGECVVIDSLPPELEAKMFVHAGEGRWRVAGIETHAMPRSHTNGDSAGLLLEGEAPPAIGEIIEIERIG